MKKTTKRAVLYISGAALAIGVLLVVALYNYVYSPIIASKSVVCVKAGGVDESINDIVKDSLLVNVTKFRFLTNIFFATHNFKPGNYLLTKNMSTFRVVQMLRYGRHPAVKIIINPVRTPERLSQVVAGYLDIDQNELLKALKDPKTAGKYGFSEYNFFTMFIPNTYEVYWNVGIDGLLDRMKTEYDKFWTQNRKDKLARVHLTENEVITLASILYEETQKVSEMPRIAGVYINRLRLGMPLQADPTVKFALNDFTIKRVLKQHLSCQSPYNTYKFKGLPPGPIAIPSAAAIDAVLDYEDNKFIYFCAKDDFSGSHVFSTNFIDHLKNARAYSRALDKLGVK